jgi:PKD repeat protein
MNWTSVLASLSFAALASGQVILPAGMAAAEGSIGSAMPWGGGALGVLHQCVYDSAHFTSQGINTPILITGLRWRPNGGSDFDTGTYPDGCTVRLSTAPFDHTAVTTSFAANHGPDLTTCYRGVVAWLGQPSQPVQPFCIGVTFPTAFFYDPSAGDLNIECDIPTQTVFGFAYGVAGALDAHGVPGQALASAVQRWAAPPVPAWATTQVLPSTAIVVQVDYVPVPASYAGFTASVTEGPSPLTVNFRNRAYSNAPGGVLSYAWDFDGDSVVDSTAPNPSWTYASCGSYAVSLTVTDGVNPPQTLTRANFIRTDRIVADFSYSVLAPQILQFTATSDLPATSWAWDFDGDTVVDSNLQNPVWIFANPVPREVSVTVARSCGPAVTVTKVISGYKEVSTTYAGNGGQFITSPDGTVSCYDLGVQNPQGVEISGFATNLEGPFGTPFAIDVYVKRGSYSGFELTPSAWTKVGVASGTTVGAGQRSSSFLATPVYLPQGSYAIALHYTGASAVNTRHSQIVGGTTFTVAYANADLSLTLGNMVWPQQGSTAPFLGFGWVGGIVWNGSIYYETHDVFGGAAYGWFGEGCGGTLGMTSMPATTQPTLGGTLTAVLDNLPLGLAVVAMGASNSVAAIGPLPLDLGPFGAPGCPLRVSVDVLDPVVGVGTSATWNVPIPNLPVFSGLRIYTQAAVLDPASNAFGFALSRAYAWILGS